MAANSKLVCLANAPFFAGAETAVLDEALAISPGDTISEAFLDDPWWGIVPLTIRAYVAGTYPTFNTWDEIMFDAVRASFRCGNDLWVGKLMAYITPVGSRVLVS